jgi:hypothetical protein
MISLNHFSLMRYMQNEEHQYVEELLEKTVHQQVELIFVHR